MHLACQSHLPILIPSRHRGSGSTDAALVLFGAGVAIATRCRNGLRRLAWCLLVLGGVLAVGSAGTLGAAESSSHQEHEVKALYLFNFTKYVEWPEPQAGDTNLFLIGVIGAPEAEASLVEATQGKEVGGKRVVIRRFEVGADLRSCHMLYVGTTYRGLIERTLEGLRNWSVLTVGEGEAFLDRGGMVGFVRRIKKVRLLISLDTARRADLHVSAKLLAVAESVRDGRSR